VITPQLRDAALKVRLHPATGSGVAPPVANAFVSRKASNAVRTHLAGCWAMRACTTWTVLTWQWSARSTPTPSKPSRRCCAACATPRRPGSPA
jgi:hypothetical protein